LAFSLKGIERAAKCCFTHPEGASNLPLTKKIFPFNSYSSLDRVAGIFTPSTVPGLPAFEKLVKCKVIFEKKLPAF
jgi:hypothetical protein